MKLEIQKKTNAIWLLMVASISTKISGKLASSFPFESFNVLTKVTAYPQALRLRVNRLLADKKKSSVMSSFIIKVYERRPLWKIPRPKNIRKHQDENPVTQDSEKKLLFFSLRWTRFIFAFEFYGQIRMASFFRSFWAFDLKRHFMKTLPIW